MERLKLLHCFQSFTCTVLHPRHFSRFPSCTGVLIPKL